MGGKKERTAAGDHTVTPKSPIVPGWKALRRAFVNPGVKKPCKYPSFINMTWSRSAKCKEALLQAWGAGSFREKGRRRGFSEPEKKIPQAPLPTQTLSTPALQSSLSLRLKHKNGGDLRKEKTRE
ncbi:hypothetical protein D9C73_002460 [Xyrichtys novacula]|uniref:Uncharacterized protein n=1 Tax=Xyrichtys novacula TaxID=13765 RepID=A0AAV1EUX2_XYRNO|nr:hypothetical protein D9C73_002460 [Xyrichtys novacula]